MVKQSGAVEAWWAHNPQVDGSKPSSANTFFFFLLVVCMKVQRLFLFLIFYFFNGNGSATRGNFGWIRTLDHTVLFCSH